MKNKKYKLLLLSALISSSFLTFAQKPNVQEELKAPKANTENIPYSMYGVGYFLNNKHTINRGMGGVSIADKQENNLNLSNPATISFLENISLDFAVEGRQNNFLLQGNTTKGGTAGLSYLGLGIPFNKHLGMSVSFQPLSNMYYYAQDEENNELLGKHFITYQGSGGLNKAQLGFSGNYKGLSLGANLGYLFGSFSQSKTLNSNNDEASMVNSVLNTTRQVGGLYWDFGALMHIPIKNEQFIDIGLKGNIAQNFNANQNNYAITNSIIGEQMLIDTLRRTEDQAGELVLPASYGLGLAYGKKDLWKVLAEANYTDWSTFSFFNDNRGIRPEASYDFRLGATFTPSKNSDKLTYFHMMNYRGGLYFQQDHLQLENAGFQTIGGSIGFSLPLRRQYNYFAKVHLAFDAGQRKTNISHLGTENFIKMTIGVSLNDIWFVRPKYD
ncbi:MAG TPA: hypothetical protein VK027_00945 [Chitinophagaceae bacterium]|nr:hypothetical protein [Chitinophagaceae bacterium]